VHAVDVLATVRVVIGQSEFMETVPITAASPGLDGVLGSLPGEDERQIRVRLLSIGDRLVETARRLGGRCGWHGSGFELHSMPSGQVSIWGSVEALDAAGQAVAFEVELRPGWFGKDCGHELSWQVDLDVDADCQQQRDCGQMHNVFEQTWSAASADDAITVLGEAVSHLERLAAQPLSGWLCKAGD